jgi:carbonic anhydrase
MSDVWTELLEAHETARRADRGIVPQHEPNAAVLSCSDARVPPSVVFGQAHGDLFIVRNAGNNATPAAIASLDFAVGELDVDLIVVMGHTECGAVAAAAANVTAPHLAPIVDPIRELCANQSCADVAELGERNVLHAVEQLTASQGVAGPAIRDGRVKVVAALYDLAADSLRELQAPDLPQTETAQEAP